MSVLHAVCFTWSRVLLGLLAVAGTAPVSGLTAQTDYYNTDAGRPVRIEDAYPVERYAFEAQIAPLRLERADGGEYHWEIEPELAYGIFPRTHVEVGLPLLFADAGGAGEEFGIGGIDVALFHNLNVETRTLPAFAIAAEALLPVGALAPDRIYPSVKGIATRTFKLARVHLNGQHAFGADPKADDSIGELSRWMAGVAIDKTFPLQAMLLIGDVYVERSLLEGEDLQWTVEAGTRYQLNPFFALDAGVGRRVTGGDKGWFLTFGAARVFAVRSLIPVLSR